MERKADRHSWLALLISFILLSSAAPKPDNSPRFQDYPPEHRLAGKPARVRLSTPQTRHFRGVLRKAAKLGPNYNGHYRVAYWGCGTNCIEWAILDLSNGHAWISPEGASSCAPTKESPSAQIPDWIVSRIDSRLLVVHRCRDPAKGRTFDRRTLYEWRKGKLKLIRSEALP